MDFFRSRSVRRACLRSRARGRASSCTSLGLLLVSMSACASRDGAAAPPATAASSPRAPEAALANVTLTLSGEPPLPSQPSAGWTGLAGPAQSNAPEAAPAAADHAAPGHHEHGGHHHGAH
jgi:hypothetical protein